MARYKMKYHENLSWFCTNDIGFAAMGLGDNARIYIAVNNDDKFYVSLVVNKTALSCLPYNETVFGVEALDDVLRKMQRNVRTAERKENGRAYPSDVLDRVEVKALFYEAPAGSMTRKFKSNAFNILEAEAPVISDPETMEEEVIEEVKEAAKAEPVETPVSAEPEFKPTVKKVGLDGVIEEAIIGTINSAESKRYIKDIARKAMDELGIVPNETTLTIKPVKGEAIKLKNPHKQFEEVLAAVSAGVNVALVGPAGSGKTTTVSKAAEALGLDFYAKSVSAQTGVHEFMGYHDANGNYVTTLFRKAYENGGVFLLDEFDAGNPNVLATLNAATANGTCAFADGMVKKHENFICFAAGNTYGTGATADYVGRNPIDGATLDRFVYIDFDYDEELELKISGNAAWAKKVQKLRKRAKDAKIRAIISPRASINGAKLLAAGLPEKRVLDMVVFKGMTEEERNILKAAL